MEANRFPNFDGFCPNQIRGSLGNSLMIAGFSILCKEPCNKEFFITLHQRIYQGSIWGGFWKKQVYQLLVPRNL